MHEAAVAEDVLEIIMDSLRSDSDLNGKKVTRIQFKQSFPPTVVPDSFEFYFSELVRDTVLMGAELSFETCEERGFFISSIHVD